MILNTGIIINHNNNNNNPRVKYGKKLLVRTTYFNDQCDMDNAVIPCKPIMLQPVINLVTLTII